MKINAHHALSKNIKRIWPGKKKHTCTISILLLFGETQPRVVSIADMSKAPQPSPFSNILIFISTPFNQRTLKCFDGIFYSFFAMIFQSHLTAGKSRNESHHLFTRNILPTEIIYHLQSVLDYAGLFPTSIFVYFRILTILEYLSEPSWVTPFFD